METNYNVLSVRVAVRAEEQGSRSSLEIAMFSCLASGVRIQPSRVRIHYSTWLNKGLGSLKEDENKAFEGPA